MLRGVLARYGRERSLGGALIRGWPVSRRVFRCLAAGRGESGQRKGDKDRSGDCARGSKVTVEGLWRGDKQGGGRSARGEDADWTPARCLTLSQLREHGR
jgi:hypothetical protein